MENIATHWRPLPQIRTKALGIVRRDSPRGVELLLCAIMEDGGEIKGWRPLGGSVDFGERAETAVLRELSEEIFATAKITGTLGVIENIYTHHGETGHEVVFLYEIDLIDAGLAKDDRFVLVEDNGVRCHAEWVPLADFTAARATLFPEGLLARL